MQALHRGVGALNALDQCSARSPRSVLEMVGASSRRTPRLPLTKGTRDRNAVEKRWWPARRIFPIFGAVLSLARGALAIECIWYPFFSKALGDEPTAGRPHLTPPALGNAAPAGTQPQQASRRPSPPRAPLPRRRVRRGCADPAPPAGPSGAAGSGQPLGTLRSPPRPRGGANRAGERAPPLLYGEPRGGWFQRT